MAIYSEDEDPNVEMWNEQNKPQPKEGTEVTVNVPFTYTIGEEGPFTGKLLETIQDCKDEAEAELLNGLSGEIHMEVEVED